MANHVNVKEIGELIDEEPFNMNWFSFDLGGGWGSRLTKYKKKGAAQGIFTPGIDHTVPILKVYKKLKNNDFSEIAGFYVAILCFFGEKFYENINFVEKTPHNSINKVVSAQKCPKKYENEIYEICHSDYDFIDFIEAAAKLERTNFNPKSAISIYKLQKEAAIYPLLCQMFYSNKGVGQLNPCLISETPIHFPIEISNYLSGCHFPVAVSPSVSALSWHENQNGHFLYGKYKKEWLVMDVAGVGRVNLSDYALTNRLNYLGGGGECLPYLICWNWKDVVEAYRHFHTDLLIRDLKNNIFNHYWFIFGENSLINVRYKDGYINFDKDFQIQPPFTQSLISTDRNKNAYLTVKLNGDFVNYCEKKDVFYSDSEVFDWFELGNMIK